MTDASGGGPKSRPDIATLLGLAVACGGILWGMFMEGGAWNDLKSPSAALIVLGGTLGAVMVTTPLDTFMRAGKRLRTVFFERAEATDAIIEEIIGYAARARKNGIVALEDDAQNIADPFLKKAMNLAVDGTDLQDLRKMMELDLAIQEQRGEEEAKVFESAGGYAPTIGIIGAVLGLIQVMKNIENTKEVGAGIAVAFIATVYGVGSANIFFLPAANKIKSRLHRGIQTREMILEGVVAIVEGLNPKLIRSKLEAFATPGGPGTKAGAASARARASVAANG
jgi:chemotaxis protein MotA